MAGGDGSVGKVLREISTNDVRVTLVPAGSANNVAGALGISPDVELYPIDRRLGDGEVRPLDTSGIATAPWGEARFLKSRGTLFGEVLAQADDIEVEVEHGDEKIDLGLERGLDVLEGLEEREWRGVDADRGRPLRRLPRRGDHEPRQLQQT